MHPGPIRLAAAWSWVLALAACSERPLPYGAEMPGTDAGVEHGEPGDAGDAGDSDPPPGVLDWAIAVAPQAMPTVPGSAHVTAVLAGDDGGATVAGWFTGRVGFASDYLLDGGTGTGFVARYRRDQRFVWQTAFSSDGGAVVVSDMTALGGGEVTVAGWYSGTLVILRSDHSDLRLPSAGGLDLFVVRLASDGSVRWARRAGGPSDDIARGVAGRIDSSGVGSIALTGAIADGAVFGPGEAGETTVPVGAGPIYAALLTLEGDLSWVRFAGRGVPGQGYGVAHDVTGAVAVTGYVNGIAAFGNDVNGAPVSINPADGRAFVARWDVGGRLSWAQPLGGPEGEGDAIAVGGDGTIVATGLFKDKARFGSAASAPMLIADSPGQYGAYLAAFAPAGGAAIWARRLVGIGVRPWRLRAAPDGDLLVAASFGGGIVLDPDGRTPRRLFSSGSTDALFARLDSGGALRWATAGGGPGDEQGADVTSARDGTTWAVGTYFGPATFGAGSAFGAGAAVELESGTDGGSFLLRLLEP